MTRSFDFPQGQVRQRMNGGRVETAGCQLDQTIEPPNKRKTVRVMNEGHQSKFSFPATHKRLQLRIFHLTTIQGRARTTHCLY